MTTTTTTHVWTLGPWHINSSPGVGRDWVSGNAQRTAASVARHGPLGYAWRVFWPLIDPCFSSDDETACAFGRESTLTEAMAAADTALATKETTT